MSQRVLHGALSVELPVGWRDESTVTLTAPGTEYPTTVSITFEPVDASVKDSSDVVRRLGEMLREAGVETEDLLIEAVTLAGLEGTLVERRVSIGGRRLRQLTAATLLEGRALVATATIREDELEDQRPAVTKVFESIALAA